MAIRHLLAVGRSLTQNQALREAFCLRHIGAGATSLAIHATVIGSIIWLSAPVLRAGVGGNAAVKRPGSLLAIFAPRASSGDGNSSPRSERAAAPMMQASKESGPVKDGVKLQPGEGKLEFPGFTFDVEKLLSHGETLFPFLTRTINFNIEKPPEKKAAPLINPFALQPALELQTTPLLITDAEVQRLVDDAWARRERWVPFQKIRALVDIHDPDVGQVPALLRGHVNQNALQPYLDTKMRDPRLWTQLALAADHDLFIDYIADYVSRHPGTKASIELLFLLDTLAQGSLDTLTLFLEIKPERDLKWTQRTNPGAFKAITQLHDYYMMQRERRGLDSHRAIGRHYDLIRMRILSTILETAPGGYRTDDARYLLGELHWRRDRFAEAKQVWRQMRIDPRSPYAEASGAVLEAMREAEGRRGDTPPPAPIASADARRDRPMLNPDKNLQAEVRAINAVLEAEYQRWVNSGRERLKHFGYALDSF